MKNFERPTAATLSIAAVERDTGLSKDTLRVWERRYGFPAPLRDAVGERAYCAEQVDKLRLLKRLLEAGHRPGRIVPLPLDALQALSAGAAPGRADDTAAPPNAELQTLLALLRQHDGRALAAQLRRCLAQLGTERFVLDVVAPLNLAVGDAWLRGGLEIFEEHLCTEAVQAVLRQAIASIPPPAADAPRVLLSTLPGEPHGLGLLMAEALFALQGCDCQSLGTQTPPWDIVLAARACRSDIVVLAFSGCMNPNHVVDGLTALRAKLAPERALWVGGSAPVLHRRRIDGVLPLASLDGIGAALRGWLASVAASTAYSAA